MRLDILAQAQSFTVLDEMPVQTGGWHWQRCECCRVQRPNQHYRSSQSPPSRGIAPQRGPPTRGIATHKSSQGQESLLDRGPAPSSRSISKQHLSLTFHCFSSSTLPLSQQAAASCSPTVTLSLCSSATTENNTVR